MRLLVLLGAILCFQAAYVFGALYGGSGTAFCAIQTNFQAFCWGNGFKGMLGNGRTSNSAVPVKMLQVTQVTAVAVGGYHTCVVDEGKAKCAGLGDLLGRGANTQDSAVPVNVQGVAADDTVVEVFASNWNTCLLTSKGGVKCWGSNKFWYSANSTGIDGEAIGVDGGFEHSGVKSLAIGHGHICILTVLGKVQCVGANHYGQLGRGTVDALPHEKLQPVLGAMASDTVVSISSRYYHNCAVNVAGKVYCWGSAYGGGLGLGVALATAPQ